MHNVCLLLLSVDYFETGSYYATHSAPELLILLPQQRSASELVKSHGSLHLALHKVLSSLLLALSFLAKIS